MTGPLTSPMQVPTFTKQNSIFKDPNNLGNTWGWWISNIYQISSTELLAFSHLENCQDSTLACKFRIGLAYSNDSGLTFTKLGYIIQQYNETGGSDRNITGVPYIVKDGYFYIYYNDYDANGHAILAAARASVNAVVNWARYGTPVQWNKYYQNAWTQPGIGGMASALTPNWSFKGDSCLPWTHGDAAYSTTLHRYILAANVQNGATGGSNCSTQGIWLAFSDDEKAWDGETLVQDLKSGWLRLAQYVTIVNADGTDNGMVGTTFYLYWGYAPQWDANANPFEFLGTSIARRLRFGSSSTVAPQNGVELAWLGRTAFGMSRWGRDGAVAHPPDAD